MSLLRDTWQHGAALHVTEGGLARVSGVSHGADAQQLESIAEGLRLQGQRTTAVGDELASAAAVLREAWAGPDSEVLLHRADHLRPTVADAGDGLTRFAGRLDAQAQQQRAASGEGSSRRGSTESMVPGGGAAFAGRSASGRLAAQGGRPLSDRRDGGPTRSGTGPLMQAMTYSHDGGGAGRDHVIEDGATNGQGGDGPAVSATTTGEKKAGPVTVTQGSTVAVSDEGVDAQGRSVRTTTVTTTTEASVEIEKKLKGTGAGGGTAVGTEGSYSVTGPSDGSFDPTQYSPLDPTALPEGASISLDARAYGSWGLESAFRGLELELGGTTGVGNGVEIVRGEGDTVIVTISDEQYREAMTRLGYGPVSAGASSSMSTGEGVEVTFDMSDPAAQQAYYDMVFGGRMPEPSTSGVSDVAQVQVLDISRSNDLAIEVGALEAGVSDERSMSAVQRTHADGTTTVDWSGDANNGSVVSGSAQYDAAGNYDEAGSTYQVRVDSVDPSVATTFNDAYAGQPTTVTGEQNVVISYDHADLQSMRSQAADTAAARITAYPDEFPDFPDAGGTVTGEQVLAYIEANPDRAGDVISPLSSGTATGQVLTAQNDREIMQAISNNPQGVVAWHSDLGTAHYSETGQRITPVGEVTSHGSSG
ncbi:hypothetical protein [Janibacter sp. UYMM211]|uniref:hypothetical protein n=1 Tax=Janibacter sp. UYMM211 TaxID=3156342 RepID=UPI003394A6A8